MAENLTTQHVTDDRTLKALLANRILIQSRAIDLAREGLKKNSKPSPDDLWKVAETTATSLAVINELERVWEALGFGLPSIVDIHRAATRETLGEDA